MGRTAWFEEVTSEVSRPARRRGLEIYFRVHGASERSERSERSEQRVSLILTSCRGREGNLSSSLAIPWTDCDSMRQGYHKRPQRTFVAPNVVVNAARRAGVERVPSSQESMAAVTTSPHLQRVSLQPVFQSTISRRRVLQDGLVVEYLTAAHQANRVADTYLSRRAASADVVCDQLPTCDITYPQDERRLSTRRRLFPSGYQTLQRTRESGSTWATKGRRRKLNSVSTIGKRRVDKR